MGDILLRAGLRDPITVVPPDQPTSMTLDNPGFANLILVIIAGVIIVGAVIRFVRR